MERKENGKNVRNTPLQG